MNNEVIDKKAFKDALSQIDNGFIFEEFAQSFLGAYLGYTFIPVGTIKDKGIDAYQSLYFPKNRRRLIYQISTEKNVENKIDDTFQKLEGKKNGYKQIKYDHLYYITNRKVNNKEKIEDKFYDKYSKPLTIYDINWFTTNCNNSKGTINSFYTFVDSYLHEFKKPGNSYIIADFDKDARLYVFLRQQLESSGEEKRLDEILADTLILFSLEGTDPDKGIYKTAEQIKTEIQKYIKFDYNTLSTTIDTRLKVLSTKPRKIKYHSKQKAYVLPYETRIEIQKRNLADKSLVDTFNKQTTIQLKKYLKDKNVQVKDALELISKTIHKVFYKQGLEFSNFILNNESKDIVEHNLYDIISSVVDESSVVTKNKEKVKSALLMTIRDIAYHGSFEQKKYLRSLSNTYMMMFMLHWDPKISLYFQTMASKLNIYVCTSIIIPALSEIYLDDVNKRHWNLLIGAKKAGISMRINETILEELISHFRMVSKKYNTFFKDVENTYLDDENQMLYVDEILIRAYFYAKSKKKVSSFYDFLNNFLDPSLKTPKEDLISYLKDAFNIEYVPNKNLGIKLNNADISRLADKIKKSHHIKAENDAKLILTIYELRDKNNETTQTSIFGYKTWWLSKDTSTYKAVLDVFGQDRFPISCYIRPDFIFNYITLTPKKEEVDHTYLELFPSLLGVNISYHLSHDLAQIIQQRIYAHKNLPPFRLKAVLRSLSEKLKSDPSIKNRKDIEHFLDQKLKEINNKST